METTNLTPRRVLGRLASLAIVSASLWSTATAAPIPKLYNTGVDDTGAPLPANSVDPHYTLIESADSESPGPATYVLPEGFPIPPWLANGPSSKWIAPKANQGAGNLPGYYTYRTTFDLTGFDPAKARISGKWASDNAGVDVVLNGVSLGINQGGDFTVLSSFQIDYGFVDGINTLDFIILNAGDAINPTGLRVEMIGTVEVAGEAPRIITQPVGGTYLAGDPVTLSVMADGTAPLTYQWKQEGTDVGGATEPTLVLDPVAVSQGGNYTVVVKNGVGEITSAAAAVVVLEPIPGLYNTGVDDTGVTLFDGSEDTHYRLVSNPDDPAVTAPIVQDSSVFPIVGGPWMANSGSSVWIGPRFETSAAAGGAYVYELEVDLTGFDPSTAFVSGQWTSDNAGALLLNDAPTGVVNDGSFGTWFTFRIEGIFLNGKNRLQFRVNNDTVGYTGLRVQGLRGGAKKGTVGDQPRIVSHPAGGLLLTGESLDLAVLADGGKPLSYQWRKNGAELAGQTQTTLGLTAVTRTDAGDYDVVVRNFAGAITSQVATVTVLTRIPGLFGTGVDAAGAALADGSVDPHYRLVLNATSPGTEDAIVHDSTVFPIVAGPWLANTASSKWIAPLLDSGGASGGDYAYRTSFDLSGFDPATVVLMGGWATDNGGTDILLNGASLGLLNTAQFGGLTSFTITSGFVAGVNTLEFRLNNADAVTGYTGLRVDGLRAGGESSVGPAPSLAVARSGSDVVVAWPASATGYKLYRAAAPAGSNWTEVSNTPVVAGDLLTVTLPATGGAEFFRLQK